MYGAASTRATLRHRLRGEQAENTCFFGAVHTEFPWQWSSNCEKVLMLGHSGMLLLNAAKCEVADMTRKTYRALDPGKPTIRNLVPGEFEERSNLALNLNHCTESDRDRFCFFGCTNPEQSMVPGMGWADHVLSWPGPLVFLPWNSESSPSSALETPFPESLFPTGVSRKRDVATLVVLTVRASKNLFRRSLAPRRSFDSVFLFAEAVHVHLNHGISLLLL